MIGQERFTGKAKVYDRYRPNYPQEALTSILETINITPKKETIVVDIGAGTGKFTKLLLDRGFTVYAIEPNKDMREELIAKFEKNQNLCAMNANAENTGLENHSISLITVAQAFHYFDLDKTKEEFKRILKANGKVALLWNFRARDSKFIQEYEKIIYGLHSGKIQPTHAQDKMIEEIFKEFFMTYQTITIDNIQEFDFEGLWGRTLSNNHAPKPEEEEYAVLYHQIKNLFEKYQIKGKVAFPYHTKIVVGEL